MKEANVNCYYARYKCIRTNNIKYIFKLCIDLRIKKKKNYRPLNINKD